MVARLMLLHIDWYCASNGCSNRRRRQRTCKRASRTTKSHPGEGDHQKLRPSKETHFRTRRALISCTYGLHLSCSSSWMYLYMKRLRIYHSSVSERACWSSKEYNNVNIRSFLHLAFPFLASESCRWISEVVSTRKWRCGCPSLSLFAKLLCETLFSKSWCRIIPNSIDIEHDKSRRCRAREIPCIDSNRLGVSCDLSYGCQQIIWVVFLG